MPEQAQQPGDSKQPNQPNSGDQRIPGIDKIIAVSSCKGGVGKSTIAVNLALALRRAGLRVGLADVDIYGPSVPMLLGVSGQPEAEGDDQIPPKEAFGIQVMSMGFFLSDDAPVIWRGPMAMSATKQFLRGVKWSELDYLVIDLPPGTGDIVLTLAQEVPLDGAVIVTTPQDVALADVKRGIAMFRKVNTPVLGVVQNMSAFVCPSCNHRDNLFGDRRPDQLSAELGIGLLGEIPIEPAVCESGDAGVPMVERDPEHPVSQALMHMAGHVVEAVKQAVEAKAAPEPVEISGDSDRGVVRIRWSDGVATEYLTTGLRGWCPCAECQGHSGTHRFVQVEEPKLESAEAVGRYAIRFVWADGHGTGMYSYPYLRELAETAECRVG